MFGNGCLAWEPSALILLRSGRLGLNDFWWVLKISRLAPSYANAQSHSLEQLLNPDINVHE